MAVKTGFKTDPGEALESGADAVVYRPGRLAAGIRYDERKDTAPVVVAAEEYGGADAYARAAKKKHIYVREWGALADALAEYAPGEEVQPELYHATAKVLARAFSRKGGKRKKKKGHGKEK